MKITKIHNVYYDLSEFNHPGGYDAIWHSYGRDATAMFEQYHSIMNQKNLQNILQKYEVPENKIIEAKKNLLEGEDNVPQFNFNSDFGNELKEKVQSHFIQKAKDKSTNIRQITKASTERWLLIGILNLLRILSCFWWLSGSWYGLIVFPIIDWISAVNYFHDACHFSLSSNWKVNKIFSLLHPNFSTPINWYYQHNIGHHSYTNIKDKDPDLYHASNIIRSSEFTKYKKIHKYQNNLGITLYFNLALLLMDIKTTTRSIISNNYFKFIPSLNTYREQQNNLLVLIFYIIRYGLVYMYLGSIIFTFLPQILFSFLFMLNSQITHLHEDTFHYELDWYKHQVLTSSNHSIGSTFGFLFSGGLNYQIEHHLFPGINHCHYPEIQPIVKSICKKHNIKYKEFNGFYDAFCSYYNHIKTLSKNKKK